MNDLDPQRWALRLRELANDDRFAGRADELRDLADEVARPDGDSWAGIDVFSAFPAESVLRLDHKNRVERAAGVLAGTSVFLPVAWTWSGFHAASDAYERMLAAEGEPEGSTFLSLWATGFEGRLGGLHLLVPMGLISLSLIIFAILCVVGHRLLADRNIRVEEKARRDARVELTTTLTGIQRILHTRRADHPSRIEGIIKTSLEELRRAHETTGHLITQLSTTADRVGEGTGEMLDGLVAARTELMTLVAESAKVNETLAASTEAAGTAMSSSVTQLDTTVQRALEHTHERLTSAVEAAGASLAASVTSLDDAVDRRLQQNHETVLASTQQLDQNLTASLGSFENALGQRVDYLTDRIVSEIGSAGASLGGAADKIGDSAESNAAAARGLTEKIDVMVDDNARAREDLAGALADVRDTLEGIETALGRHEGALQGQVSELTGARDAAERLLRRMTAEVGGGAGGFAMSADR